MCSSDLAQSAIIEAKADISLVGYDNTYLSSLSQVGLTTVDPGNREIANKCADLLIKEKHLGNETHTSTPTLVVRNSSRRLNK